MLVEHRQGDSDLVERGGVFYLMATCEVAEAEQYAPEGFIGVDLGIANIATTSTGYRAAGRGLNRHRKRQAALRAKLQAKRTKSAKRRLKKRNRRERRHVANTNHVIAKQIVTEAERTSAGIALEDLTGIRQRVRLCRPQRVAIHSWAFARLAAFIAYKAKRAGVPLVQVDPAYTSRECAECRYIDKRNRVAQARFVCRSWGRCPRRPQRFPHHRRTRRGCVECGACVTRPCRPIRGVWTEEPTRQPVGRLPPSPALQGSFRARVKLTIDLALDEGVAEIPEPQWVESRADADSEGGGSEAGSRGGDSGADSGIESIWVPILIVVGVVLFIRFVVWGASGGRSPRHRGGVIGGGGGAGGGAGGAGGGCGGGGGG
ncbi:Putative transposase DNA-binding domain protein [Streptomonospora litoralis]|uniref:Transposase DNA-binding domain protein n=2 Tax=Streptomonospora litoralis TaxID=2498135 RepID=A0A4P6PZ55_9ACTN|nr:Putative transposase DNA-binding domain protein [Streptomonospora litoralis]